jgi:hypothetical protein
MESGEVLTGSATKRVRPAEPIPRPQETDGLNHSDAACSGEQTQRSGTATRYLAGVDAFNSLSTMQPGGFQVKIRLGPHPQFRRHTEESAKP